MDGTVTGVSIFVDLTVAHALETSGPVQSGSESANPGEHIKIAYQVISSPSCCRARRKPRTFKKAEDILIHVPGLCLLAFFCCQIQIAQLFPNQPTDGR